MTPEPAAAEKAPARRRRQHQERASNSRTVRDLKAAAETVDKLEAELARAKIRRDRLIVRRYQEGASFRQIDSECGVSRTRVEQIVRAAGANG